jgi:hypothetical protein
MSERTTAEVIATLFFALSASGGMAYQRNASMVINEALRSGAVTDKDARCFLANLAEVAEEAEGPTP